MNKGRQGSALLIVLGFLSFMVVSAVAFAIYMRAERMPSSAARRTIATRHLVKAALAEAISRVDDAVRDDPFPGFCATNSGGGVLDTSKFYHTPSGGQAVDVWCGRVFMPPSSQSTTARYAPVSETVSVLNLEALGYVPPPLVNDVRFLSRASWAASWQPFPFDAGRFAYCVVNVSDYLDVNRAIPASKPRTAEYQRRLSLAHLFDTGFSPLDLTKGNSYEGRSVENPSAKATAFDALTSNYVPGDNISGRYEKGQPVDQSPYVSVLDYNLALSRDEPFTPIFYNWLTEAGGNPTYYEFGQAERAEASRQPFVTDSWSTNEIWQTDLSTADISTLEGQPFNLMGDLLEDPNDAISLSDVINRASNNKFFTRLQAGGALDPIDYAMLFDYLDFNDIPLSLAYPCVERVPMVAGLAPPTLQLKKSAFRILSGTAEDMNRIWGFNAQEWLDGGNVIPVVIPFPFKRYCRPGDDPNAFKAQMLVRLVLAPKDASKGRLANLVRPTDQTWNEPNGRSEIVAGAFNITCLSRKLPVPVRSDVSAAEEACVAENNGTLYFRLDDFPRNFAEVQVLEEKPVVIEGGTGENPPKEPRYLVKTSPYTADGQLAADPAREYKEAELAGIGEVVPHVFVWVRILNKDDKTVDLVPAGLPDDEYLGGRPPIPRFPHFTGELQPVFHFFSENAVFSIDAMKKDQLTEQTTDWNVKAILAVDPRFNYAPEHWYPIDSLETCTFSEWLRRTRTLLADSKNADHDADIFMTASNQGVLQSLGEFGFLPAMSGYSNTQIDSNGLGAFGADAQQIIEGYRYLWRTYDQSAFYRRAAELGVGRSNQKECLVNPHTDNLGVMMAALANTPYDYWVTAAGVADDSVSLNNNLPYKDLGDATARENKLSPKTFDEAAKFAFNSRSDSSGMEFTYENLLQVAKTIMGCMGGVNLDPNDAAIETIKAVFPEVKNDDIRGPMEKILKERIRNGYDGRAWRPSDVWQSIWDDLWAADLRCANDDGFDRAQSNDSALKTFLGVTLGEPLHTVDRKFLYSYWRDCFANNQQLFLIFVRAESSALGGPGEGTPAQLGGRAVALVWRDPDWSGGSNSQGHQRDLQQTYDDDPEKMQPHRTRVLFYHQFD